MKLVARCAKLSLCFQRDAFLMAKVCLLSGRHDRSRKAASIMLMTHVLEKGIAHANRRELFGQAAVASLMGECHEYVRKFGCEDRDVLCPAREVLREYVRLHGELDGNQTNAFLNRIRTFVDGAEVWTGRGAKDGTYGCGDPPMSPGTPGDLDVAYNQIVLSRHSIRDFGSEPVDLGVINACVALAQQSPSSCNRQSARVYVIQNRQAIRAVLDVQNGARGACENVQFLLLIAGELACYQNSAERHLVFVDGSLFAMTLMYALHARGLASSFMHCALTSSQDRIVRAIADIAPSHVLVVAIAVGAYPESPKVTPSRRLDLSRIVQYRT